MTGTMQTVKLLGSSRVEVRDVPIPEPGPGEALIRIAISAICGSELPAYHRPEPAPDLPYNTGHEMGGVVVRSNGLCRVSEGQRVGLQIFSGCGQCRHCLQGDPEHCVKGPRAVLNAHSEYVVASEVCLIPLPDDLAWEAGVLMAGDPIGTPYHALKRMGGVHAGQTAAIFGFGPIGQGFMALLRYYGVRTIVSEMGAYRRELAAKLGASLVLDPSQGRCGGSCASRDQRRRRYQPRLLTSPGNLYGRAGRRARVWTCGVGRRKTICNAQPQRASHTQGIADYRLLVFHCHGFSRGIRTLSARPLAGRADHTPVRSCRRT